MKKNVLIHYHIFKNAGSTIDWILRKNFGKDALTLDESDPDGHITIETMLEFLQDHPNAKSFSSHQLRFPVPQNQNYYFLPIVFIRHPIDRIFSIYHFLHNSHDVNELNDILNAKNSSLKDFVEFNLKFNPKRMRDNQLKFLARRGKIRLYSIHYLFRAFRTIKNCTVLGIVERMDESLVLAEEILQNYFPDIDLAYISQNVRNKNSSLEKRLEEGKTEIGETLMNQLITINKLDFSLYKKANTQLNLRIAKINNFNQKLNDFQKRCSELADRSSNY
jgi:hypothetical protein